MRKRPAHPPSNGAAPPARTAPHRRAFIGGTGLAASAAVLAAPAPAQPQQPVLRWRLTSSYPRSLDAIYGAAEVFSRAVAELTDDRF